MKRYFYPLYFAFLLLLFFQYSAVIFLSEDIFDLILHVFLPSLYPSLLLLQILLELHFFDWLYRSYPIVFLPLVLFLCFLLGAPSSFLLVSHLEKHHFLPTSEKERILSSFATTSFPFLYRVYFMGTIPNGATFFFILLCTQIASYLSYPTKKNTLCEISPLYTPISKAFLKNAMLKSAQSFLWIAASILLFNLPFSLFPTLYQQFPYLPLLLEFSYANYQFTTVAVPYKALIQTFSLCFGSLSIFLQCILFDPHYRILQHIKRRFFIASIATLLAFLLCF